MLIFFFYAAIAGTFFSVYLYYAIRSLSHNVHIHGQTPPGVLILFRLAWKALCREQGQVYDCDGSKLDYDISSLDGSQDCKRLSPCKDETITICNYRIKDKDVKKYKTVCGEKDDDTDAVPICYPECLFIRSLLLLVCKPQFRLSPLGLIHVSQTITQHEDLETLMEGPVSLRTQTKEYRITSKGVEVDIEMRVISASDQCVWSGVATLLSRSRHVQRSGSQPSTARLISVDSEWDKQEESCTQMPMNAAGNVGVKYASVSGDWNPHHLFPWTARLLGYRAPIAHGMWTLSKAMACMKDSQKMLTDQLLQVEGKFKRPLFLPGAAQLEFYTENDTVWFRVVDMKTRAPHLVGSIVLLNKDKQLS